MPRRESYRQNLVERLKANKMTKYTDPLECFTEAFVRTPEQERKIRAKEAETIAAQTANKAKIAEIERQREKAMADFERDEAAKGKIEQLSSEDYVEDPSGVFKPAVPDQTNEDDDFEIDSEFVLSHPDTSGPEASVSTKSGKGSSQFQALARELSTSILTLETVKFLKTKLQEKFKSEAAPATDGLPAGKANLLNLVVALKHLISFYDDNIRSFSNTKQKSAIVTSILSLQRTIALLLPKE